MGIKVELKSRNSFNRDIDGGTSFVAACGALPVHKNEASSYSHAVKALNNDDQNAAFPVATGLLIYLQLNNFVKRLKIAWHMRVANSGVRHFVGNFHIKEASMLMLDIVEERLEELSNGKRTSKEGLFLAEYFTKAVSLLQVSQVEDISNSPEELLASVVRVLDAGMKIASWERAAGISLLKLDVRLADFARAYLGNIAESFDGDGKAFARVKKGLMIARFVGDYIDDAEYHRRFFKTARDGVEVLLQTGEYSGAREVFEEFVKKDPEADNRSLEKLEWKIDFSEHVLGASKEIAVELAREICAAMEAPVEFDSLPKGMQEKYVKTAEVITGVMLERFAGGYQQEGERGLSVYMASPELAAKIAAELERDGIFVTQKMSSLITRFVSVAQLLVAKRYISAGLGNVKYPVSFDAAAHSQPQKIVHNKPQIIPPVKYARFARESNSLTGMLLRTSAGANMPSVAFNELKVGLGKVLRTRTRIEKK